MERMNLNLVGGLSAALKGTKQKIGPAKGAMPLWDQKGRERVQHCGLPKRY